MTQKFLSPLPAALCALSLAACSAATPPAATAAKDLDFSKQQASKKTMQVNSQTVAYRAYEHIVYVKNPVDTDYQSMNIYIPEAYFNGGSINGYTAQTAPIFFPNQVGGYMPGKPGVPGQTRFGPPKQGNPADAMQIALAQGYIVASPGARGRTAPNGKAPAAIVDLKAAVRYLKANDKVMPGDAEKIFSNGTSAGGALSVLLGATGNNADYEPYLKALGAAEASDAIFAVSAYCPISLLDHADAAYEWQFNGINEYKKMDISMLDYKVERKLVSGQLTPEQIQLSDALKPQFPAYVNSLGLKDSDGTPLTLDKQGNGSFKQYVQSYLMKSAQGQLDAGKNLSDRNWLTIRNGKVIGADFFKYAQAAGRMKTPPAFDALDLSSGENQLFGTAGTDKQHFTEFSQAHNTAAGATRADPHIVDMMNPMGYIGTAAAPDNWRIRVGTADRDTSLAVAAILTAKLRNSGKTVDFATPWDIPHSGDYDLDELFAWMKQTAAR